eukprot:240445_1
MDRARPMKNVKNAQSINNSPIRYPILTQKENRNNPFLMFNESNLPNYTNPVHQSIQAHDKLDDIANDNGTASSASTSFNIIKGIMGVALLTLPWSIANVGLLPSVIFLFLSFILSYISWIFLCLLCEHYSVYSYRDIGLVVFGPWFATVLDLVLLVFLYLISILYVMFLSQFIIAGLAAFNIPVDTTISFANLYLIHSFKQFVCTKFFIITITLFGISLLIPLETIVLVFNMILGAKFLNETMRPKDYIGISLIFVGVVISVLAAPKQQQEDEYTIHELVHLFTQSSFWMFITCYTLIVFSGQVLYQVPRLYDFVASKDANIFMIIFVNISAYFGSWNAILLKSVLEIMASSFDGKFEDNFVHVATYLLFIGFVGSLLLLEFWRQKALALYVSTYVLAVYRVFVTTAGVLFGAFYWNDFVGTKGVYIGIYVLAILVSFVGVAVITLTENTKMFGGEKKSETNVEQAQNVCDNEDNQL